MSGHISGIYGTINIEQKRYELSDLLYDLDFWHHPWPRIFIKVKFWNGCISGMGGLIDMEWKGYILRQ